MDLAGKGFQAYLIDTVNGNLFADVVNNLKHSKYKWLTIVLAQSSFPIPPPSLMATAFDFCSNPLFTNRGYASAS